jgi:glycosyltransferase involved in cell wall biosynthesis
VVASATMRVAIDARPALDARKTGVGYYAQHIIRALPNADPEMHVTAWYLHAKGLLRARRFFADVGASNFDERSSPFPARVFEPVSSRLGVPRLEWLCDFDVVLATNFLPPATRSPGVVMMVHDLAFQLFPDTAPQVDARWRRRFDQRLHGVARILVPSKSAKDDLVRLYGVEGDRIDAICHGVDADAFRPAAEPAVQAAQRRYGIVGRYLLFVGGIEPRKNLPGLVRAFAKLDPDATLVLAGGPVRWYPKATEQLDAAIEALPSSIRGRVVRTGYVSDAEKLALLTGATLFAYPSTYEGFGMPVLEAMACGTPVLTSSVSSLPEVAGEAAVLVDPAKPDAIAGGMDELLMDEDLRNRLAGAGLARAASFTWEKTAKATAASLRRAAGTTRG